MRRLRTESLAGNSALIISQDKSSAVVKFGNDVRLISTVEAALDAEPLPTRPEITGHLDTSVDYSKTRNATMALEDGSKFDVWFFGPQIFAAQSQSFRRVG